MTRLSRPDNQMNAMQSYSPQDHAPGDRLQQAWQRGTRVLGKVPAQRWRQLAALLIVIWLSWSLARLFWLLAPTPEVPAAQLSAAAISTDTDSPSRAAVDIDSLKDLQLFGAANSEAAPEAAPVAAVTPGIEDEAVDTKLNLVLRGVIASSEESGARAIIADAKTQAIYSPGDDIEGQQGVKLAKVLPLRVILDNRGQYESLWLYKDDPNAPRTRVNYSNADLPPSRSWEGDPEEYNTEASDMNSAPREEVMADPVTNNNPTLEQMSENLSDVVAFNIHREGGRIRGYRIRPGRNAEAFESLGLQSGDIVTAVNGTRLDNPGRIMEIYRELGDATSASLEIERDGELITVDVGLN